MATISERDFFAKEILSSVGRNANRLPDKELIGFLSMTGNRFDHELMVVGRAVNGWDVEVIRPNELSTLASSEVYAGSVFSSVTDNIGCPMTWVTKCWGNYDSGYNTKGSAFWRVIRAVVSIFGIADVNESTWPSYLVWSNLYKVAPVKGNPGSVLCDIQFSGCVSLLQMEIATYHPRRLLLLTGLPWAKPFLERAAPDVSSVSGYDFVEAIGQVGHSGAVTKIVVAAHPQGKHEASWVSEVTAALNS